MWCTSSLLPVPTERVFELFELHREDADAFDVLKMAKNGLPYLDLAMCSPPSNTTPTSLQDILLQETKQQRLEQTCLQEYEFIDCFRKSIADLQMQQQQKQSLFGSSCDRTTILNPILKDMIYLYKLYRVLLKDRLGGTSSGEDCRNYVVFVPVHHEPSRKSFRATTNDNDGDNHYVCDDNSELYKVNIPYYHQWENGAVGVLSKVVEYLMVSHNYATLLVLQALKIYEDSLVGSTNSVSSPPLTTGGVTLCSDPENVASVNHCVWVEGILMDESKGIDVGKTINVLLDSSIPKTAEEKKKLEILETKQRSVLLGGGYLKDEDYPEDRMPHLEGLKKKHRLKFDSRERQKLSQTMFRMNTPKPYDCEKDQSSKWFTDKREMLKQCISLLQEAYDVFTEMQTYDVFKIYQNDHQVFLKPKLLGILNVTPCSSTTSDLSGGTKKVNGSDDEDDEVLFQRGVSKINCLLSTVNLKQKGLICEYMLRTIELDICRYLVNSPTTSLKAIQKWKFLYRHLENICTKPKDFMVKLQHEVSEFIHSKPNIFVANHQQHQQQQQQQIKKTSPEIGLVMSLESVFDDLSKKLGDLTNECTLLKTKSSSKSSSSNIGNNDATATESSSDNNIHHSYFYLAYLLKYLMSLRDHFMGIHWIVISPGGVAPDVFPVLENSHFSFKRAFHIMSSVTSNTNMLRSVLNSRSVGYALFYHKALQYCLSITEYEMKWNHCVPLSDEQKSPTVPNSLKQGSVPISSESLFSEDKKRERLKNYELLLRTNLMKEAKVKLTVLKSAILLKQMKDTTLLGDPQNYRQNHLIQRQKRTEGVSLSPSFEVKSKNEHVGFNMNCDDKKNDDDDRYVEVLPSLIQMKEELDVTIQNILGFALGNVSLTTSSVTNTNTELLNINAVYSNTNESSGYNQLIFSLIISYYTLNGGIAALFEEIERSKNQQHQQQQQLTAVESIFALFDNKATADKNGTRDRREVLIKTLPMQVKIACMCYWLDMLSDTLFML